MMAHVDQQSVCDRELFSELTESPIARQSKCDREFSSELTESPFAQQSVCDRELSSELTEHPIVQQTVSDRKLFSELAEPPIAEQTVCDWELFTELFETPIHPMLLNMVPPYVNVVIPTFDLQINGEGIWRWREVSGRPKTLFELLQKVYHNLDTDSRNLVVNAWGKHLRKAYGDFGSRSSPPQTAKRENN